MMRKKRKMKEYGKREERKRKEEGAGGKKMRKEKSESDHKQGRVLLTGLCPALPRTLSLASVSHLSRPKEVQEV